MAAPKIKVEMQHYALRVYVNDILHVSIPRGKIAVQSWRDGPAHYSIEYQWGADQKTLTEYDSEEKWKAVLEGLDRELQR